MSENQLQQKLALLRSKIILMAVSVSLSLERVEAVLNQSDNDLAEQILADEKNIDSLENEIDGQALEILVRFQPLAQDLRFVVSVLRMVLDLERIGDEISSIAKRLRIGEMPDYGVIPTLCRPLLHKATKMYAEAMEAFTNDDLEQAMAVLAENKACKSLEEESLSAIMAWRPSAQETSVSALDREKMASILICHSLSRICQRSANIAEHTVFIGQGLNLKHGAQE